MQLKSIFKKDKSPPPPSPLSPSPPEIKFIRSDTNSEDVIRLPTGFPDDNPPTPTPTSLLHLSRPRSGSTTSRFRESFQHLGHRRNRSGASSNIPADLPVVRDNINADEREAEWEKRATMLVGTANLSSPTSTTAETSSSRSRSSSAIVTDADDENIQQAIQYHEAGDLTRSTALFRRLADFNGANNPLAQVLYGLALRHGWGIEKDAEQAVKFLQAAAKNSAAVEEQALKAGMKKGGSAKGELTLAIYELGNSYRNGWGVSKDPVAAREYYETAANLGDSDAQNEVAWCYLEGFGCKKDKKKSARFYRMAEKQGNKTLGNTWIYKDKYMTGEE
ncbi:hypothetical protein FN846DRAFT_943841 [Sphaerosporella brunnea]|uniref:HCP-like protein n=1 Tax=Sphaerosporella brunnea TaxID=1250544 RepID=A0A5J5EZV2_9PEZI|nr:hypothetical protein FN846DRAFT_943841 [Sphaerosporella brunnea]